MAEEQTFDWWRNQALQYKADLDKTNQRANKTAQENETLSSQIEQVLKTANSLEQQSKKLQAELDSNRQELVIALQKKEELVKALQGAQQVMESNLTKINQLEDNKKKLETDLEREIAAHWRTKEDLEKQIQ